MGFDILIPTAKSLQIDICFGEVVLATATAVLVADDESTPCVLKTNRHNVTGRHQETGDCLNRYGAIPDSLVVYAHRTGHLGEWIPERLNLYTSDQNPLWVEHPTLGADADIVALHFPESAETARIPYWLKGDRDRCELLIGPAESLSVIGFPLGLASSGRFPIWATGFMAQELGHLTDHNPLFLIDCRTRRGQSGSAVIAYRPSGYRTVKDGRLISTLSADPRWEFLGIYSGRVSDDSDLGRVWHVKAIEQLYQSALSRPIGG